MRVVASIPTKLVEELKEYAASNGTSMNKLVNGWLNNFAETDELTWAHGRFNNVEYSKIYLNLTERNGEYIRKNKVIADTNISAIIHGTIADNLNFDIEVEND